MLATAWLRGWRMVDITLSPVRTESENRVVNGSQPCRDGSGSTSGQGVCAGQSALALASPHRVRKIPNGVRSEAADAPRVRSSADGHRWEWTSSVVDGDRCPSACCTVTTSHPAVIRLLAK